MNFYIINVCEYESIEEIYAEQRKVELNFNKFILKNGST